MPYCLGYVCTIAQQGYTPSSHQYTFNVIKLITTKACTPAGMLCRKMSGMSFR